MQSQPFRLVFHPRHSTPGCLGRNVKITADPKGKSIGELAAEVLARRKQNRELEQANVILKKAAAFFSPNHI